MTWYSWHHTTKSILSEKDSDWFVLSIFGKYPWRNAVCNLSRTSTQSRNWYAAKKKHLPYIHTYVQSKNSRLKRTSLYWRALGSLSWLRIWFFTISSVIPEKWSLNNSTLIYESSHKTILGGQIIHPSFFDDASLSALVFWFLFSLSK